MLDTFIGFAEALSTCFLHTSIEIQSEARDTTNFKIVKVPESINQDALAEKTCRPIHSTSPFSQSW